MTGLAAATLLAWIAAGVLAAFGNADDAHPFNLPVGLLTYLPATVVWFVVDLARARHRTRAVS